MKELPKISEAEFEVMKILWTNSPLSANEVVRMLEDQTDWNPKTVRTLLNRLVQKGAIAFQQEKGKVYAYYPIVSQDDYLQVETKSFLQRLYGGAFKPLLVHFLREEKLTREEIDELKQILDDQTDKNSDNR
ncbi:BlaI/MecI/CopY family transcriptional regulator [Bacillus sp. T3]|uniref:BlaI/MecI/CopY family transcriptional regulator n=1 Tax=Bacillus sp. T3 TaxID=467262 RepID=UPI002982462D|nr:BlaI/MecI/CopY family transcriptional regulator [Bacillus sp. T3]